MQGRERCLPLNDHRNSKDTWRAASFPVRHLSSILTESDVVVNLGHL